MKMFGISAKIKCPGKIMVSEVLATCDLEVLHESEFHVSAVQGIKWSVVTNGDNNDVTVMAYEPK